MTRLAWLALASAGVIGAYLGVMFLAQRSLLFPIPAYVPGDPGDAAEVVRITGVDSDATALFLAPRAPAGRAPLLVFMHGNGELADDWLPAFDPPRASGVAVLLLEYPGYGRAPGSPSEKSITAAARAAYDWAAADPRIDPARIVAYGRSLGGGAAARLAVERTVAALILESSFTSVADFARFLTPSFLIRDRFDNRNALASYRGPLLIIHGRHDRVVPIEHSRELATLVPGARLEELNCGHNDCPRPWNTIGSFLVAAGVIPGR